jgi:hypothetical protein
MVNEFVLEGWPRTLNDSGPADAMEAATGAAAERRGHSAQYRDD